MIIESQHFWSDELSTIHLNSIVTAPPVPGEETCPDLMNFWQYNKTAL